MNKALDQLITHFHLEEECAWEVCVCGGGGLFVRVAGWVGCVCVCEGGGGGMQFDTLEERWLQAAV